MMLKGIELKGGLRDYYLAQHQIIENQIEKLKVFIQVAATFGNDDIVSEKLKLLDKLLGFAPQAGDGGGNWMDDPEKVAQNMEFLKNFKGEIKIG